METLKHLPIEHHEDVLNLLHRAIKVARQVRHLSTEVIVEKLDYIEEKLKEDENYFNQK